MKAIVISSEIIYYTGVVLIGLSVLAAVVAIPVFYFAGKKMKKRLEEKYGE